MNAQTETVYAALAGDLVLSRRINAAQRKELYAHLAAFVASLKAHPAGIKFSPVQGDGFLCLLEEPKLALQVALLLRSFLVAGGQLNQSNIPSSQVRMYLGLGAIDFKNRDLNRADGEAFVLAGRGLSSIANEETYLGIATGRPHATAAMAAMLLPLDQLCQQWSPAQAATVHLLLRGLTQAEAAASRGISQSAINQQAKAAHWQVVKGCLTNFEQLYHLFYGTLTA